MYHKGAGIAGREGKYMVVKNRALYIFKYLWDNTDEEHPATTADILAYLQTLGVATARKTVAADVEELQQSGFDIVRNRSRQNEFFIGSRYLEVHELKMLIDAVQAAKFISIQKTMELIKTLSSLTSPTHGYELQRNLFVEGKAKTSNEKVYYVLDALHTAIREEKTVSFQYTMYDADKKKVLKHDGQKYILSPYNLVWCNDAYYVIGFSESHGKIIKFRVDRIYTPTVSEHAYRKKPSNYNIADFCRKVFSMYNGKLYTVELKCANGLMKEIVDRFGEDVPTRRFDDTSFIATVEVSVSPTFYAWIFTYGNNIQILSPDAVRQGYIEHLKSTLDKQQDP